MGNELFTIGYSPHLPESFLHILRKYKITAVADVRSLPYSQFKSEFNKEKIAEFLKRNGIAYVFLGDVCGARVEDPSCCVNGKVDFTLVSENPRFKEGLKRIISGMEKYRVALMCAEKDPITCHRAILICRNLASRGITIKHILSNGRAEENKESEQRLLQLFNLNNPDMFRSEEQRLDDAYLLQGKKIAHEAADPKTEFKTG
jgi:uncharacterized protein (DUF488 family)